MQKRACGTSGLELSVLGLGCWEMGGGDYWGASDQKDADAVVAAALDVGVNYFDTAEAYNDGRSEQALGAALAPFVRDRYLVGSKISPSNCYPGEITRHCEASLARLGLDHLDVYMIHWPLHPHSLKHFTADPARLARPPELADALGEFARLRSAGKIRHFGVSNFGPARLDELGACPPAVNELPYNLLSRAIEYQALDACRSRGIGIIGYMVLLQGVLGAGAAGLDTLPPQLRRTRHFDSRRNPLARHGENGAEDTLRQTLAELHRFANGHGCALPELAIRWVAAEPAVQCALVGARRPSRLADNARAAATPLTADAKAELDRITEPLKREMGPGFDYYEGRAHDRT